VLTTLIEVVGAPALAGVATLTARRWGPGVGGVVSAFPAIVGPVLLIAALARGPAVAARTADGTLLGLVALSAFAVAYGLGAQRWRWPGSLTAGWLLAGLAALTAGFLGGGDGPPAGLLAAAGSLGVAYVALRAAPPDAATTSAPPVPILHDVLTRMFLTAALVIALAAAGASLGPIVGGMLAALPVLASLLAVFTHRQDGGDAATALLRGTVAGMAGFVAFVEVVALLIAPAGTALAFAAATAAAVVVQALTVHAAGKRSGRAPGDAPPHLARRHAHHLDVRLDVPGHQGTGGD
jgi:hypothetical protein